MEISGQEPHEKTVRAKTEFVFSRKLYYEKPSAIKFCESNQKMKY